MIPSAVASEVTDALRSFLSTGFGPSNPELAGVIVEFLAEPENLVKGPYLSVALPYRHAPEGGEPFPEVPLGYTPYRHQRTAFSRLAAGAGRSTVIATGTGSGKTECFLLPILDYCREQASTPGGRKGIKAILIYPMNALATDQARRIAKMIHATPALRGRVTAGLFIGQAARAPQVGMGPEHIVADRESLLEQPPDILLTNYKMLDYLLVRPSDQRLWRHNEPGTLRYLAVDELHTFDGAQGTDLACLIRRLRARLGAGEGLVCAGTSATLGGEGAEPELRAYVSRIFDQPFEPGSIVGETRQSIDEFLAGSLIGGYLMPRSDLAGLLDRRQGSVEAYVRALHELFFGVPIEGDFESDGWRVALADRLREHATFVNLLRVLDGRPVPVAEVANRLRRSLPVASEREAVAVLDGLCALISVARRREGGRTTGRLLPFLQVGLHLWIRELRRMVCGVGDVAASRGSHEGATLESDGETLSGTSEDAGAGSRTLHRLRHSDDLKPDDPSVHLPLIQCRECRATGWGAVKSGGKEGIERDLPVFYNRFFARDVDVQYLFPGEAPSPARGIHGTICGGCGRLTASAENAGQPCAGCGADRVLRVFRPESVVRKSFRGGRGSRMQLSRDCPYCGAVEALIIFGARASSLLSVALGQTFASRHNDDQKVIAFSDNVQDAAHRAGFVAARTWPNNVRAAIAQVVEEHGEIRLSELIGGTDDDGRVVARWRGGSASTGVSETFDARRFVSEFIAPDRLWLQDFTALKSQGRLPRGSDLPGLVARRLRWEALAEFGHRSTIGRTLERTRAAAIGVDRERLDGACGEAHGRIREIGGLREVDGDTVRALLLGILRRMKTRGAIWTDLVQGFLANGASRWWLTRREIALPDFGPRSPLPVFPTDGSAKSDGLEPLHGQGARRSWYLDWAAKVLAPLDPLSATHDAADVLFAALDSLNTAGLVQRVDAGSARAWALDPTGLYATSRIAVMHCERSNRVLVVPERETNLWQGVPCLDLAAFDAYGRHETPPPTWFGRLYRKTAIRRLVSAEHTALLTREERAEIQERFADPESKPWEPNVLSATPTLELGIDIGDLSTVVLCSVPPAQQNYLQRIGRAGRRDGNALTLTVATGRPHDLYFYEEPLDMLAGKVEPPGVFLNASAVLERQLTAFCFDRWAATGVAGDAVPHRISAVLDSVEKTALDRFPYPLFDFVQERAEALLEDFFAAFSDNLDPASRTYLRGFLHGDADGQPSLRLRLLDRFAEVARERKSLRAEVDTLRRRIGALRRSPEDDSVEGEIEELKDERAGLQGLLRRLNRRNTFNFLTDEGLLPNYAFPQEGVTLKSVIYRQRERGNQDSEGKRAAAPERAGYSHETYEYMRPAASALGELAPENHFYAGGRRVQIDRIDLRLSEIESWRLCRTCSYCERVDVRDGYVTCPRCGDSMWADEGQRRNMLPLRLVHATTPDRYSRIVDERDDREPLFYTRQLVADFEPDAVERAYAMPRGDLPFGFEYISSATFREMNFGRLGQQGQPTMFAGCELPRDGFRICGRCGKVQGRHEDEPVHARTCPVRSAARTGGGASAESSAFGAVEGDDSGGDSDIVECLYLYRQFRSEAVRMLLPVAVALGSERRVASFVAALELGLKGWFSGQIDHLRVMTSEYPDAGTNTRRRYLMLYDTVPGGTGYLKELMSEPEKLLGVFRTALDALRACLCNDDPEKDGCYRCVFAYRRGRDMASTSRTTAAEILEAILAQAEALEEVEGLAAVKFAPPVESELEERFVEALPGVAVDGEAVRVRRDLVGGKPGYVLTVAGSTWYMEPQVDLGPSDRVAAPCRPDFVMRPARASSKQPPIAVFTDGFEFHRDRTDDDSLKRLALVRAGYLVWSLTWRDVVGEKPEDAAFDLFGAGDTELQAALDGRWDVGALRARLAAGSSLELLARYLADPRPKRWKQAVFAMLCGLFDTGEMLGGGLRSRFEDRLAATLPEGGRTAFEDLEQPVARAGLGAWAGTGPDAAELLLALPLAAVERGDPDGMKAVVHLHDDVEGRARDNYRQVWNATLRLFNLLQFLPGAWWTTRRGIEGRLYDVLHGFAALTPASARDDALWREAFEFVAPDLLPVLETLSGGGAPAPEVGFELCGEDGVVVAEAELAWPERRFAVVWPEHPEQAEVMAGAGWQVVSGDLDDVMRAVGEAFPRED